MEFYDQCITSVHDVVFGRTVEKKGGFWLFTEVGDRMGVWLVVVITWENGSGDGEFMNLGQFSIK